jgi:hypothetical protein
VTTTDLPTTHAPDMELIAERVHNAWMKTKRAQGFESHLTADGREQMVPYADLADDLKELDRVTVRAVYAAIANAEETKVTTAESSLEGLPASHPDPEWLASLRKDMEHGIGGLGMSASLKEIAGRAVTIASSRIAPLYRVISDLKTDVASLGGDEDRSDDEDGWSALLGTQMASIADKDGRVDRDAAIRVAARLLMRVDHRASEARLSHDAYVERAEDARVIADGKIRDRDAKIAELNAELLGFSATLETAQKRVRELMAANARLKNEMDEFLQPAGDIQARLGAMWDDIKDEGVDGTLRIAAAGSIAERHMLRMVTAVEDKSDRWRASPEEDEVEDPMVNWRVEQDGKVASAPLQYLPLPEVTDGHVRAYREAFAAEQEKAPTEAAPYGSEQRLNEQIRAGLTAIQWPSREVEQDEVEEPVYHGPNCNDGLPISPEGEYECTGCADAPGSEIQYLRERVAELEELTKTPTHSLEMREVPVGEIREGDAVTVSFVARGGQVSGVSGLWLSEFEGMGAPTMFLAQDRLTVSRPDSPLPDKPGSRGMATVRGTKGVRVYYADHSHSQQPWFSETIVNGGWWHAPEDLSDYVPLLDGEE